MRLSLVPAVVLGLASAILGAPQHGKHTPCSKNTTDIGSHRATQSGQLRGQGQFLGLHPTTTTATATSPPPGKDQEKATPTPTGSGTQLDADSQEEKQSPIKTSCTGTHGPKDVTKQPKSTPPPESTPQKTKEPVLQPLKPTTTPPPAPPASSPESSPTPEPTQHQQNTNFLVQPKDGDKSDDQSSGDSYLKLHNALRANHSAPALVYSETIASFAQKYADSQDCPKVLQHSGGPYGENLGEGDTVENIIKYWYSEVTDYDWNNPTYSHFTQIVWVGAKELGCGQKNCGDRFIYLICNYDKGNIDGQYKENVLPHV